MWKVIRIFATEKELLIMTIIYPYRMLLAVTVAVCVSFTVHAQTLEQLWQHPTNDYRMKTWWFFGYEHTTDEGITADVEALSKAGSLELCRVTFPEYW